MDVGSLRELARDLPNEPGVYQFIDDTRIIYIGKAVDIQSRVRSYADPRSYRIKQMVEAAKDLEIAVTDTETQALLLEANLIKRHQPRFNVRLTDDKSYPLVQLTNHEFPRIEVTRDPSEAAMVWGPFTDKGRVDTVVKAIRETYGIRGCSDHKFANRDRPCLDHDIGLCSAPCTNEISPEAYSADVATVKRFFDGAKGVLADSLRQSMEDAAAEKAFERAANIRDRLEAVEAFNEGGGDAVRSADEYRTRDILGAVVEGDDAIVGRLHAEGGKLVDRDQHVLETPGYTTTATVLSAFIPQFYAERKFPDALILSDHPEDNELLAWLDQEGVVVSVPGGGREARLVDLALKNAHRRPQGNACGVLASELGIERAERIEGFDVSHASGKSTVGSNVVFEDGIPDKAGYRRKRLRDQNDDIAAMEELLRWRTARAVEGRDERRDPDLLVIDGGTEQLSVALEVINEYEWGVPVVSLAKAEEIVYMETQQFDWSRDAEHLHLLQRVRDEAHRFARQYHQLIRDEISTIIDDVPGIGPVTRNRLLRRFGSIEGIRSASINELQEIEGVGSETATTINAHL